MKEEDENIENENEKNGYRNVLRLKRIILVLSIIFIVVILLGGGFGYKYHNKYIQSEIEKTNELQKELDAKDIIYQLQFKESIDSIESIYSQRRTYEKEMLKYKFKYEEAQKKINLIVSMRFNQRFLDSLARFIKYK